MEERGRLSSGVVVLLLVAASCSGQNEQAAEQKAAQAAAKATVEAVTRAAATEVPPTPTEAPTPTAKPSPTALPTSTPAEEEQDASGGDLELLGIVRAGTPSALIGFDGRQEVFRKGDSVFDHGTVKEVREDSVVLRSAGKDVTLKLAEATSTAPPPAPEPVVQATPAAQPAPPPVTDPLSRADARALLKDLKAALEKAEAKRVSVGGGHGLQLAKVDGSGELAKLGLRSGDVLQSINGAPIKDLEQLPDLLAAADGKELTIGFTREDVGLTIARPIQ